MSACLPSAMGPGMHPSAIASPFNHGAAPSLSSFYAAPMLQASSASADAAVNGRPITHTQSPIVAGASVLAVKYADGVMLMADTLGSYGSMGMFKHLTRMRQVNDTTLFAASGEYSDLQHIAKLLEQLRIHDFTQDDGAVLTPAEAHSYLGRVMYNRRSKVDPLWNQVITAGFDKGKSFLGMTDIYGSTYESDVLASGYGLHLAIPLLRKHARLQMSAVEARKLLEDCMRVLFYRDCRTLNSFQVATVTAEGINITEPFSVQTHWELARQINPMQAK